MADMLGKLWDDVAGGSPPEKGMKQLRKQKSTNSAIFQVAPDDAVKSKERRFSLEEYQRPAQNIAIKKPLKISMLNIDSLETAGSLGSTPPNSPSMASPSTYPRENIWRSVFHPGQNKAMRKIGSDKFDQAHENSPTAYDWVMITALEG